MLSRLVDPVDARALGITRIGVGLAAIVRSLVALPVLLRLADPSYLTAPVFQWMPQPTRALAFTLVGVWLVSGVLFTVGWRVPVTGTILLLCLVFLLALDLQTYSNHLYLMSLLVLLLTLADSGAALSVERRPHPVPLWPVWLIMIQVSLVYGFSSITKLNDDFLSGRVLAGVLHNGVVTVPSPALTPRVLGSLAVVTVVVEAFLALALWSPRLQKAAFVVGTGLHASITLLMGDTLELLVFSMLMMSTYPLFAAMVGPASVSDGGGRLPDDDQLV